MRYTSVHKFGGAALADGPAIERVVGLVGELAAAAPAGERAVLVVSAHLGVTSLLDELAHAAARGSVSTERLRLRQRSILAQLGLDPERLDRWLVELARLLEVVRAHGALRPLERDLALSFGERMSARVVAAALTRAGLAATPVDAYDLGLTTDSNHGQARPLPGVERALREALAEVPGLPVVTGFLARDGAGNLTTLGRNGSDLSAALIAEAVGARELVFWKAVGGVMSADPRLVPGARTLPELAFEEAAELAFHGAEVLHPAALAPARRAGVAVWVRDVRAPRGAATRLVEAPARGGAVALASRRELALLVAECAAPELRAALLARALAALERLHLEPVLVSLQGLRVAIALPARGALAALEAELGGELALVDGLAQLALIGRELGPRALEVLSELGLAPALAALGERAASQVFVLPREALERAACALHAAFLEPAAGPGAELAARPEGASAAARARGA